MNQLYRRVLIPAALLLLLASTSSAKEEHKAISIISNNRNLIALTFDDGPNAYSAPILDILDKYQVKAAFFQIGKHMQAYPEIAQEVNRRGHEIGNHSMSHPRLPELKTIEEIQAEIRGFQILAKSTTGIEPTVFRAPFLKFDNRVWAVLNELNLPAFNASVYADYKGSGDLNDPSIAAAHADTVAAEVQSGTIILMHEREITLQYLGDVIQKLQEAGYIFCTISELQAEMSEQ